MDDDKLFDDETKRPRIKVTDRRKFKVNGTPQESDAAPTEAPDDVQSAVEQDNEEPAAHADTVDPPRQEPRIAAPDPSIADLPRDFSAFVEGMYLEAMLYMGAIPDPRSGETIEDEELAKYKIDLLGMLQEKTDGNLTLEEAKQLEEALYQLRMVYLQKSQAIKP